MAKKRQTKMTMFNNLSFYQILKKIKIIGTYTHLQYPNHHFAKFKMAFTGQMAYPKKVTCLNKGTKLLQEKSEWYEILPQPRDCHK
jgi:hypothetical protein